MIRAASSGLVEGVIDCANDANIGLGSAGAAWGVEAAG
jgi:hypothetical protein